MPREDRVDTYARFYTIMYACTYRTTRSNHRGKYLSGGGVKAGVTREGRAYQYALFDT